MEADECHVALLAKVVLRAASKSRRTVARKKVCVVFWRNLDFMGVTARAIGDTASPPSGSAPDRSRK
jgi:hypothetical protein